MKRNAERVAETVILSSPVRSAVAETVLVASEDEARRRRLATALARDGHHVVEARAPLELLHRVQDPACGVALVVLELNGEDWCVPELLEVLAAEPRVPPVIALCDDALESPPFVTRLPAAADDVMLRAEVMSHRWSPAERGAA